MTTNWREHFLEVFKVVCRKKLNLPEEDDYGLKTKTAKALNINPNLVSGWYKKSFPNPENLIQIYKVFGISPNELLGIEPARFLQNSKEKSTVLDNQVSNQIGPFPLESEGLYVTVMVYEDLDQLAKKRPEDDNLSPRINLPATIAGFGIVLGERYGMTIIKGKTGMEPKINEGDAILVNFSDVTVREEDINEDKIYLVQYKDQNFLRYVAFQDSAEGTGYMFSREGGKSTFVLNGQHNPILGHVVWVCRKL